MTQKVTKARRIFEDTYSECRWFLRHNPEEDGSKGYNGMIINDNECIYTKTANEIWKYIEAEKTDIALGKGLGFDVSLREKAIRMVEETMKRQYIVR